MLRHPWTDLRWIQPPWDFLTCWFGGMASLLVLEYGAATLIWLLSSGVALFWIIPLAIQIQIGWVVQWTGRVILDIVSV
jgi:hypothetical protein